MPNVMKDVGTTAKYALGLVAVAAITVVTAIFVGPLALAIPVGFVALSAHSIYKEMKEEKELKESNVLKVEKDKGSEKSREEVVKSEEKVQETKNDITKNIKSFLGKMSSFFRTNTNNKSDEDLEKQQDNQVSYNNENSLKEDKKIKEAINHKIPSFSISNPFCKKLEEVKDKTSSR